MHARKFLHPLYLLCDLYRLVRRFTSHCNSNLKFPQRRFECIDIHIEPSAICGRLQSDFHSFIPTMHSLHL